MWPWTAMVLLVAWVAMGAWQHFKPMPQGISMAYPERSAEGLHFLSDETWLDQNGERHSSQRIFDEILSMIDQAQRLLVLDVFLFNDFAVGANGDDFRPLSSELTEALVRQKRRHPGLDAVVITDPLNTFYGGLDASHFDRLRQAGVSVVISDLNRLRASNPLWSGIWHLGPRWLDNNAEGGWLPNALGPGKVTLRSYLALLNFNANHRKTLVVDSGESWAGLVTSANPHDASSLHGNVALRFEGGAALDLLASERSVARWSGVSLPEPTLATTDDTDGTPRLQVLTEGAILDALMATVKRAGSGDRLDIAIFYLSHRPLIAGLKDAHRRGVRLRILLDPNRDAFGLDKGGIPNRPVAQELDEAGIEVRWCVTLGEQCHSKLLLLRPSLEAHNHLGSEAELLLGSANFTRRNLEDFNLETSVRLVGPSDTPAIIDAQAFFDRRWTSTPERRTSEPFEAQGDVSIWQTLRYRIMEATGLSTF